MVCCLPLSSCVLRFSNYELFAKSTWRWLSSCRASHSKHPENRFASVLLYSAHHIYWLLALTPSVWERREPEKIKINVCERRRKKPTAEIKTNIFRFHIALLRSYIFHRCARSFHFAFHLRLFFVHFFSFFSSAVNSRSINVSRRERQHSDI